MFTILTYHTALCTIWGGRKKDTKLFSLAIGNDGMGRARRERLERRGESVRGRGEGIEDLG